MPAPLVAAAVAEGASAIGSSLINSATSKKNIKLQAKYNREMAQRQYDYQLDMWNRQNQYNAPSAQMERYKAAGLNPHLIYGNGSSSAGNATTMPQYQEQAPDFSRRQSFDPSAVLSTYNRLALARENVIMQHQQNRVFPNRFASEQMRRDSQSSLAYSQSQLANENWIQLEASREYNLENAKAKAISANKSLTQQDLDIAWKRLQEAVYRNTSSRGLSLDQARLVDGWSDILNGNFLTPQAKSVYVDAGAYGADILKHIVPAKILSGVRMNPPKMRTTVTYDAKGKRKSMTRSRENYQNRKR